MSTPISQLQDHQSRRPICLGARGTRTTAAIALLLVTSVVASSAAADTCPVVRDVRVAFPPSLPEASDCGGDASNYTRPRADIPSQQSFELHVVSVYEGEVAAGALRGEDGDAVGSVRVVVHPTTKPVVLALSSYDPVRWELSLEPGARVAHVLTQGYYDQEVIGLPSGVSLTQIDRDEVCSYAYGWETRHNRGGSSYSTAIASIRERTGLVERSFQGCYQGSGFVVPYLDGEPAPCTPPQLAGREDLAREQVRLPACDAVTRERDGYCVTRSGGALAVVGLTSGETCTVAETAAPLDLGYGSSLAWRGETLYSCGAGELLRVSLVDGAHEALGLPCDAVTDFDGGLLVTPPGFDFGARGHRWYASLESILDDRVDAIYPFGTAGSRMTADGDVLLTAWHSTDHIERYDLRTQTLLPPLTLEGFDGWVLGLAVTAGGDLIVSTHDGLRIHSIDDGRLLRRLGAGGTGLACAGPRLRGFDLQRRPVTRRRLATLDR